MRQKYTNRRCKNCYQERSLQKYQQKYHLEDNNCKVKLTLSQLKLRTDTLHLIITRTIGAYRIK
jgi:hypothetical protein